MSFARFLRTISDKIPPAAVLNMKALSELDPDKIYVENVRSVLRVPHGIARRICEMAVAQGVFRRFVAVECPDGSEAAEAERESELPPTVTCMREEDGFMAEVEMPSKGLRRVTFYRLVGE